MLKQALIGVIATHHLQKLTGVPCLSSSAIALTGRVCLRTPRPQSLTCDSISKFVTSYSYRLRLRINLCQSPGSQVAAPHGTTKETRSSYIRAQRLGTPKHVPLASCDSHPTPSTIGRARPLRQTHQGLKPQHHPNCSPRKVSKARRRRWKLKRPPTSAVPSSLHKQSTLSLL